MDKPDTRLIVLNTLIRYEQEGTMLKPLLIDVLEKYKELDGRDRAFIGALAEGVTERLMTLDWIMDQVSSRKSTDMKPVIRMILRMGTYQIVFMDHVPDRAAVNEAVKLACKKHMDGLKGFVNGVLRGVIRLRDKGISYPDCETECSVPAWIAEIFRDTYGEEKARKMMRAGISESPLYLRADQNRTDAGGLQEILKDEGITTGRISTGADNRDLPYSLVVKEGRLVPKESEAFIKGLYSIQDISSQEAVYELWDSILVNIKHDSKVDINAYDICSAPGGKACFLTEFLNGSPDICRGGSFRMSAFDISEAKLEKLRENIVRTGLTGIETAVRDASLYDPSLKETADIIIADLPCSGLGVMGRKVDIKYRVRPDDIAGLCELQRRMLDNAADYLKKQGILLFSVCTVTREETADQAEYLQNKGLHKIKERQLLQGIDPGDGFYYSVWKKS